MARQYTKIDVALASALYEQHHSCGKVAGIIGATAPGVWRALKRAGVAVRARGEVLKALHADPEFRAASSERLRRMWSAAKAAGA